MKTPLISIQIKSCYTNKAEEPLMLPTKMAQATPDTVRAITALATELKNKGGELVLSDLFRSYDMQYQANLDYRSGKKKDYSPPPGGSMHEAGRAMDIDLSKIKISLADFWVIASQYGFAPIINTPDTHLKEAWHFDHRGSHALVYNYYKTGKGTNMPPYTAMAVSGILSLGLQVDKFAGKTKEAFIQSALIRLGYELGDIDGNIGAKTNAALQKAGIKATSKDEIVLLLEDKLQAQFPAEYSTSVVENSYDNKPSHLDI